MEQFEKSQQVYLGEIEGETISVMRNTINYDAENLALENSYGAKSGKESIMDQVLDICNRVYEKSNIRQKEGLCHTQEVQCEQANLHSDSFIYFKRK